MSRRTALTRCRVVPTTTDRRRGFVLAPGFRSPCALGRSGTGRGKREGDGLTPRGALACLTVLYRADRVPRPATRLPVRAIRPDDGWCDDPGDPLYNRLVRLPHAGSHEKLWRDDSLYDLVVVLDHNLTPTRPGMGSAIFLHVARPDFGPTEGCVALARSALLHFLKQAVPGTYLDVM